MKILKTLITVFITLVLNLSFLVGMCTGQNYKMLHETDKYNEYLDKDKLIDFGSNWQITKESGDIDNGFVVMMNPRWQMFFLHWYPLGDTKPELNNEYALQRVYDIWGEGMPVDRFKTDGYGKTMINGHNAVYVDGHWGESIKSRFTTWICEETNRILTSDLNINKRLGTPEELFKLQEDMEKTIVCHGETNDKHNDYLTKTADFSDFNIIFKIPESWHASFYQKKSILEGKIWALKTDAFQGLYLNWEKSDEPIDEKWMKSKLEEWKKVASEEYRTVHIDIDEIEKQNGHFSTASIFEYKDNRKTWNPGVHKYFAFGFEFKGKRILAMGYVHQRNSFWEKQVDLSTREKTMKKFENLVKNALVGLE